MVASDLGDPNRSAPWTCFSRIRAPFGCRSKFATAEPDAGFDDVIAHAELPAVRAVVSPGEGIGDATLVFPGRCNRCAWARTVFHRAAAPSLPRPTSGDAHDIPDPRYPPPPKFRWAKFVH